MNKLIFTLLIVALICALLIIRPMTVNAADTCPTTQNAYAAWLDIVDGSGRYYLINPLEQGFPSHTGNGADLQYASNPARWLVGGVHVDPAWTMRYHITYYDNHWQEVGETWFATLPGHGGVYFYLTMPAGEADHPRCDYGSADRTKVDELLKPR